MQTRLSPLPIAATFSKSPEFWGADFHPNELRWGGGSGVNDGADAYMDWVSALGANLLGYSNQTFNTRVAAQVYQGIGFSLPHYLEAQVAEKLVDVVGGRVPGWTPDSLGVRFGLSGTDATTMAVRLARAVTGRSQVITFKGHYHGWADWTISRTPPAWGIPYDENVIEDVSWGFPAGIGALDREVREKRDDVLNEEFGRWPAAIIMEHPIADSEMQEGWYQAVRDFCTDHGVIFILDEVVTGFRWALGGAAEYYGIKPDIVCYGKALGNGVPLSAIVGRREYFEWFSRNDPVFVSSTHFGNALSLAAADAVLDIWNEESVRHLWNIGDALIAGLGLAGYKVIGHGPRSLLQFDTPEERAYFIVGMRDRGILMNRPNLPNLAHSFQDVQQTVQAAKEVKEAMASVNVYAEMEGKLPRVLFERR